MEGKDFFYSKFTSLSGIVTHSGKQAVIFPGSFPNLDLQRTRHILALSCLEHNLLLPRILDQRPQ